MRVLILSYEYPPLGGGGSTAVASFARSWATAGYPITVVTSGAQGLPEYEAEGSLTIHRIPVPSRHERATASLVSLLAFAPLAVQFARHRWNSQAFDVVHSFFAIPSGVAGALLARIWNIPHVVSVLGGDVYDPSKRLSPHCTPGLKQTVAGVLNSASCIVAESHDLALRTKQIYNVSGDVLVIPLGLSFEPSPPPRIEKQYVTVVTVARLVRRKLLDRLIRAFALLPSGLAQLIIIGDGPQHNVLLQLIAELDVSNRVHLLGYIDDSEKIAQLRAADVFALVSEHEGFGLVYLEAASQGLPIVAGTIGGQVDFLEHGATGWLVPPEDIKYLSHALGSLITQPKLRQFMGQHASAVAQRYEISQVAHQYIKVFYDVHSNTRGR